MEPEVIVAIGTSAYALLSEIVGVNPKMKSNSVVQFVMGVMKAMFGKK